MKTCPYCLENVNEAATNCPHCQSSLRPEAETGSRYVRYDIDQGIIHLGKFVVVITGLLLFIGLAFYAMDLKDALEKAGAAKVTANQTAIEVQKALIEAQKAQFASEQSKTQAQSEAALRQSCRASWMNG
jgi:hypothetical protein